jgi:peptidoglycan/xylan/chitin deacetylase (PgdA/CDA1 family)
MLKLASIAVDRVSGPLSGARILIYHQVGAGNDVEMDIDTGHFRKQMTWLADTGRVRRLEEVLAKPDSTATSYVLTFDDGYRDMYENGFCVLADLGLPFTLYLTTEPMETGTALRDDGRSAPLDWDSAGRMIETGLVTVGAHTHSHPDMRALGTAQVEHEIGTSNALITHRLGIRPEHFTYPWAYWSAVADEVVRREYRSATVGGCGTTPRAPAHAIPRLPIQYSDGWMFFRPRLRGGFRLEDRVRRLASGYRGP